MPSAVVQSPIPAAAPIIKRPLTKDRFSPYTKPSPILLSSDRRSRKRKSITWQPDEKIQKVHYFEYIADERINVTRLNNPDQQNDTNASANLVAGSNLNANNKTLNAVGGKVSNNSVESAVWRSDGKAESDKSIEYSPWRDLLPIDFTPELPSPGWNSIERSAQAVRETYVLGAIDLPGQPSTLDEPESGTSTATTTSESSTKDGASTVKIIPPDSADGVHTEYQNMYNSDIVFYLFPSPYTLVTSNNWGP